MANDRMFLRCKGCDSYCLLAKNFGDWELFNPSKSNIFLTTHSFCSTSLTHFELKYESEMTEGEWCKVDKAKIE